MKAVGYTRVSTSTQANEGISLDAQHAKIKAYCELKDIELTTVICDAGKSGAKTTREGYQDVLTRCENGEIDAVVVYSLSRFTRSTSDLLNFVDTFVMKRSIELHSLSESLDTSTPTGRFMLKVLGAINELEREQIGERTKAALAHKRGQGQKTGGDVPFGYDADANGNLTENSKEQAVIRQTRNLRTQGYGYKLIAKALNEKGFTTKRGKTFNHVTVKRILQRAA